MDQKWNDESFCKAVPFILYSYRCELIWLDRRDSPSHVDTHLRPFSCWLHVSVSVCVGMHTLWCVCGGQRTVFESQFLPPCGARESHSGCQTWRHPAALPSPRLCWKSHNLSSLCQLCFGLALSKVGDTFFSLSLSFLKRALTKHTK